MQFKYFSLIFIYLKQLFNYLSIKNATFSNFRSTIFR